MHTAAGLLLRLLFRWHQAALLYSWSSATSGNPLDVASSQEAHLASTGDFPISMPLVLSASADGWAGDLGKPGVKGNGPLGLPLPSRGAALASEACVGAAKLTCTQSGCA